MSDPSINWDTENGDVIVSPLTAYATAVFAKMYCGVRLEYLPRGEGPPATVQLILTAPQAEALRDALTAQLAKITTRDTGPSQ